MPRVRPVATAQQQQHAFLASQLPAHERTLHGLALRLTQNQSDADDLLQETFQRALQRAHLFQANTQLRAWLVTLMHHLFLDKCRSKKREPRALECSPELSETLAAPQENEEVLQFCKYDINDLRHAAAKLPEDFRNVYEAHAFLGLSYAAIALKFGIEKNTVGTRLLRARVKLRQLLLGVREPNEK